MFCNNYFKGRYAINCLTPRKKVFAFRIMLVLIFPHSPFRLLISTYSVRMRENTDQNNPEYGRFSRSASVSYYRSTDTYMKLKV